MRSAKPSLTTGLVWLSCLVSTRAFSFQAGKATQCDDFEVTWTGGQAPFQLLISPAFGSSRNFSIPANANGKFSTTLNLPVSKPFIVTMSDATGFGSGGNSEIITVGNSLGGSCNSTDPGVPWTYSTPNALTQCSTYEFLDYDAAVQPVTIYGLIPGGDIFAQSPPVGPTNFTWPAVDVASGTSVMFFILDAQGRSGGVTGELQVLPANDASCLNPSSPSSTETAPSSTAAPPSTSTGTNPTNPSSSVSPAAIAATAAGAILLLAVLITLALFFLQKRRGKWGGGVRWGGPSGGRPHGRLSSAVDLTYDPHSARPGPSPDPYAFPQRQLDPPYAPPQSQRTSLPSQYDNNHRSVSQYGGTEVSAYPRTEASGTSGLSVPFNQMTGAQRKAAMAQAERDRNRASYGSRVVVHTDLAEAQPNENGVIELPPMYSAGRAPLALGTLDTTSSVSLAGTTYPPGDNSSTFTYSSLQTPIPETPASPFASQNHGFGQRWS